jgi:hypothetical protein
MSLNSSHRDLFNNIDGVIIEVSVCFQGFFLLRFLSPLSPQITRRRDEREKAKKQKKKKMILEAHQSSNDDTTNIV